MEIGKLVEDAEHPARVVIWYDKDRLAFPSHLLVATVSIVRAYKQHIKVRVIVIYYL